MTVFISLRGCLHVKFHPGMKLVPGWNHPCLWWNVSYCLHVFAEMKFHPGTKDRDEISSRDEILKWAYFFNFWRMYLSLFSKFSMFELNECMNILKHKENFFFVKSKARKEKGWAHFFLLYNNIKITRKKTINTTD